MKIYLWNFLNSFFDEYKGNQGGEALLREPGDVGDVGAGVRDKDDEEEKARPETDPEAKRQKVPAKTPLNESS